ncbi:MAG: ribbon-helix-helix protein, CopG family [Actinomycetota bacterium]
MRRTNIYLDESQVLTLRRLGERRGTPVAALVREAIDAWLGSQGVSPVSDDEWTRRFSSLLTRRARLAGRETPAEEAVERDVARAVAEARKVRVARRH